MNEINFTPLMDLTFILLITFIITFPLIEQGIPVNLPQGKAATITSDQALTITMDQNGDIYLGDARVTLEQLNTSMKSLGQTDPDTVVLVRADERITYKRVIKVLKILHDAKVAKIALVTQAEETSKT